MWCFCYLLKIITNACSLQKGDSKHSKLNKMKRQRNMQQMKEQGKNPPDQKNEKKIGSLPEKKSE